MHEAGTHGRDSTAFAYHAVIISPASSIPVRSDPVAPVEERAVYESARVFARERYDLRGFIKLINRGRDTVSGTPALIGKSS